MTRLLQEWVTARAESRPETTALVWKGERISYGALEEASNRLARALREAGCGRGDRVGILMPKSPTAIVALLGVLKADAVYVPLDPASPAARLARMVESFDDRWILAAGPVAAVLRELREDAGFAASHSIGWLEEKAPPALAVELTLRDLSVYSAEPPGYANGSEDAAHILFTSGSTGSPKGVVIPHRSVIRFVKWAVGYFGFHESDRLSGHPPLHFDLSTFDIFGAFAAGAELHLVPPELSLLPHKVASFIGDSELTQWFSVPSVVNFLAKYDALAGHDLPALRRVLWCGEILPTPALIYWMRHLPHASFTNLYGPTEATIASSYYTVPACPTDAREQIPIGTSCDGEELLVLGDDLRPKDTGEVGDLYIRGVGLSPGYWRDEEKTRAAFLRAPDDPADRIYRTGDLARVGDDGLVYFLGRKDTQIKSRGYRIELGEIEAALSSVPTLRESAVVALDTGSFEGATICCAYVTRQDAEATPLALRRELLRLVPTYMIPVRWMALEGLPKNANGKVDRAALRERFEQSLASSAR